MPCLQQGGDDGVHHGDVPRHGMGGACPSDASQAVVLGALLVCADPAGDCGGHGRYLHDAAHDVEAGGMCLASGCGNDCVLRCFLSRGPWLAGGRWMKSDLIVVRWWWEDWHPNVCLSVNDGPDGSSRRYQMWCYYFRRSVQNLSR